MGRSITAPLQGWSLLLVVDGGAAHGLAGGVHYFGGERGGFSVCGDYDFGSADDFASLLQSGFVVVGVDTLDGDHIGAAGYGAGDGIVFTIVLNRETVGDSFSVGSHTFDHVHHAVTVGHNRAGLALGRGRRGI